MIPVRWQCGRYNLMLVIIAIVNHPRNHHFYGWYVHHQKWVVYDIAIATLPRLYLAGGSKPSENIHQFG